MINDIAGRQPTLCPLYNNLHLAELFGQLLISLLGLAGVARWLGARGIRTLGLLGASWTLSNNSFVERTTSAGCRDRPRLKKNAIFPRASRAGETKNPMMRRGKPRMIRRLVRASQVINKRGRGNRWPEAQPLITDFFLSVNFLPLHFPFPLWV